MAGDVCCAYRKDPKCSAEGLNTANILHLLPPNRQAASLNAVRPG